MDAVIISKIKELKNRFNEITLLITNNSDNNKNYRDLFVEYTYINKIIEKILSLENIEKNIKYIKEEMLYDIELHDIAEDELQILQIQKKQLDQEIIEFFNNSKTSKDEKVGCYVEIYAATGGQESTLFVMDLYNMYVKYAGLKGWKDVKIIKSMYTEFGGCKEIILRINHQDAYRHLKYESGGHRVQRIPLTETQGRVHTSTCIVAVIPESPDISCPEIIPKDLRIDTFKSSGAGGQHVNKTDSAIRITHIPTGIVVECQDERSQHKNKSKALSILNQRLKLLELNKRKNEISKTRRNLLGSGDRSDRIRTYNYAQRRVTDHRVNISLYNLDKILQGNIDELIYFMINKF